MKTKLYAIISVSVFLVTTLAVTGTMLAEELTVRQPLQIEIGKTATCPVMNSKFSVTKSTPVIDYKGTSYYFCCDSCIDDFKNNPDKFAK